MIDDPAVQRVVAVATSTGLPFEIIDCDPALADTAAFCEAYGFSPDESANCVVVVGKSDPAVHAACVLLATTRLDVNGVVRRRLGSRKASFAPADDVRAMTGMEIGGVTPVGLPESLPLWIDARVLACERIIVGGGGRSAKLLVPPDLLVALGGVVVEDLAKPVPTGA